MNNFHHFTK